jgi:hypothetical protein
LARDAPLTIRSNALCILPNLTAIKPVDRHLYVSDELVEDLIEVHMKAWVEVWMKGGNCREERPVAHLLVTRITKAARTARRHLRFPYK